MLLEFAKEYIIKVGVYCFGFYQRQPLHVIEYTMNVILLQIYSYRETVLKHINMWKINS